MVFWYNLLIFKETIKSDKMILFADSVHPIKYSFKIAPELNPECQTMPSLLDRDIKYLWHPCSQMKDYAQVAPLTVAGARGSYLELTDGRRVIDAISSWWCKSFGHQHPRLKAALLRQAEQFEHVMLGHITHEVVVALSEKLATLSPTLNKTFYASDGSSAVEIALKMSLHAHRLRGDTAKNRFAGLKNGYHGETFMALTVSDLGLYRSPYEGILPTMPMINNVPYVNQRQDAQWENCSKAWSAVEEQLNVLSTSLSAIIIEPILQGAGGMLIYSCDFLRRLRHWCNKNNVYLIADEIMTGFGRTGRTLACHHAGIEADFLCLGKGLTGGFLPMSAVLTSTDIYQLFYDDYETGKAFLHSHTHSGNALAAAVALEALQVLDDEQIVAKAAALETLMLNYWRGIAERTGAIGTPRGIGGVCAAELHPVAGIPRLGFAVYQKAISYGALLRPLGNTLYWCPPLTITEKEIEELASITERAIADTLLNM